MRQTVPRSKSRKVNGYVRAVLALEAVRRKREERYDRYVRALDEKRDRLVVEAEQRRRELTGGQYTEALKIIELIRETSGVKSRPGESGRSGRG